jgi:HSP20 family protein
VWIKKDLDVSVTENTVTIKGKTSSEKKEEKGNYYRREISSGTYERVLTIPANVDSSKAKAKFRDGLLELTIPKTGKSKGTKVNVE